ncbi:PREDICTED: probable tRNA (guanine(26)-N(2))-dimethyltransferase [Dufourea novaeangliae]|uniref:tRNA (guanine(26)-N(2))-dimethyltransferase n=1 Tax=Dufourea novaeangliae TaxID=178035 RepID=A0A154PH23_DUFNO|nr:PREDICTED: probable tRNA (guanine(26)-N(2))-dimethyltransferase [Dufourea novaeangliae]KZC11161.1 putative tRNA (guanine(26)-N(2))-dimethyltransferase [Dufourea novaeangliae]
MDNKQCTKKPKLEDITLKEGEAEILVSNRNVFYNPVQEFNRDLSVAVLMIYAKTRNKEVSKNGLMKQDGITILEALSATGLRSIRYAKEVQGIKQIVANDISAKAVESIKRNIEHNGIEHLIKPSHEDATLLMYQSRRERFDVVDLDPYGCPTIFLDGAVQCVSDGGLLIVTATDMAVLAGNCPETCYLKYGAISLKSKACHEIALRILLQNIASHAARYGRYIIPVLSVSADFYIRVFVKVFSSQIKCKENTINIGMVYQCTGCESLNTQPLCVRKPSGIYKITPSPCVDQLCKVCKHKQLAGGPIWLGALHDQEFVSTLLCHLNIMTLKTMKRIQGVLNVIHEELDIPLYYTLDRLMSVVKCHTPSMVMFRSALLNAGYNVSYSHANKTSIKTDAPNEVIWDIVRTWAKDRPIKRDKLPNDSSALNILNTPITTNISFDIHPLANPASRQKRLTRFQHNPTVNWGPGTRAKTIIDLETGGKDSKKIRNQNKNAKKERQHMADNSEDVKTVLNVESA